MAYRTDRRCGAWIPDNSGDEGPWLSHGWLSDVVASRTEHGAGWAGRTRGEAGQTRAATDYGTRWRPAREMPAWASRFTLTLTATRVERLHAITDDGATAEGVEFDLLDQALVARKYDTKNDWFQVWSADLPHYAHYDAIGRAAFASLWDSQHAPEAQWHANPWVHVLSFTVGTASGHADPSAP